MQWLRLPDGRASASDHDVLGRRRRSRHIATAPIRPKHTPAFAPPIARSARSAIRSRQFASLGIDLIVVSDHGLVAVPREHDIDMDSLVPAQGALVDDEHATFSIWAGPRGARAESRFARRRVSTHDSAHAGLSPRRISRRVGRRSRIAGFGDLFLLADPGYEFVGTNPRAIYTLGEHGYDPKTPEMMGIFLAAGPDFRKGRSARARARTERCMICSFGCCVCLLRGRRP